MRKNIILETGLSGKKAGTLNKVCIDTNRRPVSKMEISIVGFTLVELIVVITILAILGTIAIMAFSGYSKNARDSARVSDISRITSSVELFQVAKGFFPEPTNGVPVTYSGATAWTQGTFGDSTVTNVEKISKKPVDPLTGSEYAYSITQSKKEFQIGSIYEGDSLVSVVNQTYAAEITKALVKGNYNGSILKVLSGSTTFVLAIPSILASDIEISTDVAEIVSAQRLVFDKYNNLPASYKQTGYELNGGFGFEPGTESIVVFSGDTNLLKQASEQLFFVEKLQAIYGGTVIEGTPEIKNILSYNATNDEEGTKLLAQVLINGYVDGSVPITALSNTPVGGSGSQGSSPQSNYKIAHGTDSICMIMSNTTVKCWGDNDQGNLGIDNGGVDLYTPTTVPDITGAVAIGMGSEFTCIVLSGGIIKCMGYDYYGQLGDGLTDSSGATPVTVEGINNAVAVEGGSSHACALLSDKTVKCWGDNWAGQLGDGTGNNSTTPVTVTGLTNVKSISLPRGDYSCATKEDGAGWCWGSNYYGRLGDGTENSSNIPVQIVGISNFAQVEAGSSHACGLLTDGIVKCWGYNYYGSLGNGTNDDSLNPVTVSGLSNALSIDSKHYTTCVIIQGGEVKCWGRSYDGSLGNKTSTNSNIPISIGITNGAKLAMGTYGSAVVLTNGSVIYFGENDDGQAGNGMLMHASMPISPVGNPSNVSSIGAGGYAASCMVLSDGSVKCMGNGYILPFGSTSDVMTPTTVPGLTGVSKIAIGESGGCAVLQNGGLKCWGENGNGQLGDGSTVSSTTPVDFLGVSNVTDVAMTWANICMIDNNQVKCIGQNYGTELQVVTDIVSPTKLISGEAHYCVIDGGAVKCWGDNYYGQQGNGTNGGGTIFTTTVSTVVGITSATALSAGHSGGSSHTCAIDAGQLKCWGSNEYGELGDGTTTSTNEPIIVSAISGATDVSVGGSFSCAKVAGGAVKCWGRGYKGVLGNGQYGDSLVPVDVTNLSNVTMMTSSRVHTCALLSNNTVKCWGSADDGELGNDPLGHKTVLGLD